LAAKSISFLFGSTVVAAAAASVDCYRFALLNVRFIAAV
jgi:hypothetical protein